MNINNVVNKTGFTQINNDTLRDRRLSAAARGILGYLLSHNDQKFSANRRTLMSEFNLSKQKVVDYLSELKEFGYLITTPIQNKSGVFTGQDWTVNGTAEVPDNRSTVLPDDGLTGRRKTRTSSKKTNLIRITINKEEQEDKNGANAQSVQKNEILKTETEVSNNQTNLGAKTAEEENRTNVSSQDQNIVVIENISSLSIFENLEKQGFENLTPEQIYSAFAENKQLRSKPYKNGAQTPFEKVMAAVTPGTHKLWAQAIDATQKEQVKKGGQWVNNITIILDKLADFKTKARVSAELQTGGVSETTLTFNDSLDDSEVTESFEVVAETTDDEDYEALKINWLKNATTSQAKEVTDYENSIDYKLRFGLIS